MYKNRVIITGITWHHIFFYTLPKYLYCWHFFIVDFKRRQKNAKVYDKGVCGNKQLNFIIVISYKFYYTFMFSWLIFLEVYICFLSSLISVIKILDKDFLCWLELYVEVHGSPSSTSSACSSLLIVCGIGIWMENIARCVSNSVSIHSSNVFFAP